MASEYKALYNEYSLASAQGLEMASLTITDELNITGANLTGLGVDDSTIQFTANQLSVKPLGITNSNIADVSVSKITGGATASSSSFFSLGGVSLGPSGLIQALTGYISSFVGTTASITNVSGTTASYLNIIGSTASITNISGTTASYSNVIGSTASITNISGTTASYSTIIGSTASITNISGSSISYSNIIGGTASITNISGTTGVFNTCQGTTANFSSYLNLPSSGITAGSYLSVAGITASVFLASPNIYGTTSITTPSLDAQVVSASARTDSQYVNTQYIANLGSNTDLNITVSGVGNNLILESAGDAGVIKLESSVYLNGPIGITGATAFFARSTGSTAIYTNNVMKDTTTYIYAGGDKFLTFDISGMGTSTTSKIACSASTNHTYTIPQIFVDDTFAFIGNTATMTNKTLTSPIIAIIRPSSSNSHTVPDISSDTFTMNAGTQTLTSKTFNIANNTFTNHVLGFQGATSTRPFYSPNVWTRVSFVNTLVDTRGSTTSILSGSTSTNLITINKAGTYWMYASARIDGSSGTVGSELALSKNGNTATFLNSDRQVCVNQTTLQPWYCGTFAVNDTISAYFIRLTNGAFLGSANSAELQTQPQLIVGYIT